MVASENSEYYAENTYVNQFLLCQATHSGINNFDGLSCVSLASYMEAMAQQSAIVAKIESIKGISGVEVSTLVWEVDDKNVEVDYKLAGSSEYFPTVHLTRADTDSEWTFVREVDNSGQ